jgi:hypothetical protein
MHHDIMLLATLVKTNTVVISYSGTLMLRGKDACPMELGCAYNARTIQCPLVAEPYLGDVR